jgi:hypothetical protein
MTRDTSGHMVRTDRYHIFTHVDMAKIIIETITRYARRVEGLGSSLVGRALTVVGNYERGECRGQRESIGERTQAGIPYCASERTHRGWGRGQEREGES